MNRYSKIFSTILSLIIVLSIMATLLVGCGDKQNTFVVGVQSKTTGEDFISAYSNCNSVGYDAAEDAVVAMINNELDFVVMDIVPAQKLLSKDEYKDAIKIVPYELVYEQYGCAFNKNNTSLINQVNQILNQMMQGDNSILKQIINKYSNGDPVTGYKNKQVDRLNPDNQLVVATNSEFEPFEYTDDGLFYGIDIEVAQYIADQLDMDLVIYDLAFEQVLDSLNDSKTSFVDIAMSGITITNERKEIVEFSVPYYTETYQVAVVNVNSKLFDNCQSAEDARKVISGK